MSEKKVIAKRHGCHFCRREFARSEHLKRHITTHTHEKSFRCFCGKCFTRRDLLKRHEQVGKHLLHALPNQEKSGPSTTSSPVTDLNGTSQPHPTLLVGPGEDAVSSAPGLLDDPLYGDWFNSNAFQSFDAFINTMGLTVPFNDILPDALNDHVFTSSNQVQSIDINQINCVSMPPDADPENVHELKRIPCYWTVTQRQRDSFDRTLQPYRHALAGFVLPSALALSRHLTGYMEDFQDHQAILHTATYKPMERPEYPELMLAICAAGALTRYERGSALRLFHASKAIIDVQWSKYNLVTAQPSPMNASSDCRTLRTVQAAMLLSTFAIMEGKHGLIHEAASLHCLLVEYVQNHDVGKMSDNNGDHWQDWILKESRRRIQCTAFNILNMYTMALDSAPALPSRFLDVYLPCSTLEWTATNEIDWIDAKRYAPSPVSFQQAYAALFDASTPHTHLHSPLGNLTLINAILQRIYLARQLQLDGTSEVLRSPDLDEIELALDRWTHAWKSAPESILDPRNPDASNSFTSTSYLGLAYVRLYTTYGSRRRLCDWKPKVTGCNLYEAPWPQRTPRIESALLHAAQAFAIPVKYGIEYLGRKQFHHWDLQNFIWQLEAAIFLSKWLLNVADTCHHNPPSESESRLISVVNNLVVKAEESIDPDLLPESERKKEHAIGTIAASLSRRVARLWACLYHKQNSPWGLVDVIGQSLAEFDELMAGQER